MPLIQASRTRTGVRKAFSHADESCRQRLSHADHGIKQPNLSAGSSNTLHVTSTTSNSITGADALALRQASAKAGTERRADTAPDLAGGSQATDRSVPNLEQPILIESDLRSRDFRTHDNRFPFTPISAPAETQKPISLPSYVQRIKSMLPITGMGRARNKLDRGAPRFVVKLPSSLLVILVLALAVGSAAPLIAAQNLTAISASNQNVDGGLTITSFGNFTADSVLRLGGTGIQCSLSLFSLSPLSLSLPLPLPPRSPSSVSPFTSALPKISCFLLAFVLSPYQLPFTALLMLVCSSTACASTNWTSSSSLTCLLKPGIGSTLAATVTGNYGIYTLDAAFSYNKAVVSTVNPANVAPSNAIEITMSGSGFGAAGYSQQKSAGSTGCEASVWLSNSGVVCKPGTGHHSSLTVALTVGLQPGSLSSVLSYDRAEIAFSNATQAWNIPSTGSVLITITGLNLSPSDKSTRLRLGYSASEASIWISESCVMSRSLASLGSSQQLKLTVGERQRSLTEVLSYSAGALSGVGPSNMVSGSMVVTVVGSGLGNVETSPIGRKGFTACETTVWISDSVVVCNAHQGISQTWTTTMTAGMSVSSATEALSFDRVSASSVLGVNGAGTGSVSMT
eukprot:3933868-Rhodomonas_salina.1